MIDSEPKDVPPPETTQTPNWPLLTNLFVLLVAAGATGFNMVALAGVVTDLVVLNGIAGVLLLLAGHRIPYALAFFSSALLITWNLTSALLCKSAARRQSYLVSLLLLLLIVVSLCAVP